MRDAFFKTLIDCTRQNNRINLLVGDLGFKVTEEFKNLFPGNFLNVGVAEQNMTGLAAGMALAGKICITYSIGNFSTLRCLEQIRNDVCYHNLDVKIVSVGGGVSYGAVGATHHATEDLAIMRALPNMKVLSPNDPLEVSVLTEMMLSQPGPFYLRLGRAGEQSLHSHKPVLKTGEPCRFIKGRQVAVLATGGMLSACAAACENLRQAGLTPSLFSVPFIKPINIETVIKIASEHSLIVTVEDHSVSGGLGSCISEIIAETSEHTKLLRIGFPDEFSRVVGDQAYIHEFYQLTPGGISARILAKLR